MDHKKIIELYSIAKILSNIELGDSLTKLQKKTDLSYTTVKKIVDLLQSRGLINTKLVKNKKGIEKQCIYISIIHKLISNTIVSNIENNENSFESEKIPYQVIFKLAVMQKTYDSLRRSLLNKSEILETIFEDWLNLKDMDSQKTESIIKNINQNLYDNVISFSKDGDLMFDPNSFSIAARIIKKDKRDFDDDQKRLFE